VRRECVRVCVMRCAWGRALSALWEGHGGQSRRNSPRSHSHTRTHALYPKSKRSQWRPPP